METRTRAKDVISSYYDDRKHRTRLIENSRNSMQEILKKVDNRHRNGEKADIKRRDFERKQSSKEIKLQINEDSRAKDAVEYDEEKVHQKCSNFSVWLRSISQCLSNKISQDPVLMPEAEDDPQDEDGEEMDEDERCMNIVRSVFDEETATEVLKSYLTILRDAKLPEKSKLGFRRCQFDEDSGCYTVQSFLDCYVLSRNKRLLCKRIQIYICKI